MSLFSPKPCSLGDPSGFCIDSLVTPDLTGQITTADNQYCAAGGFGDVYRCQCHSECGVKEVAVKTFRFEFTVGEEDMNGKSNRMMRRELGIWKRLNHPNVVPFLGTVSGFGRLGNASLVSSWMSNGTLQDFLLKYNDKLTVPHRLRFMLGIANGLQYLHSLSIVHGDLTCNNVLLDEEYNARLTDFGYASLVGEIPEALSYLQTSTLRPGAVRWAAPEYFFSSPEEMVHCTIKSDIYSFGNIALQVLSGELPWSEFRRDVVIVLHLAKGNKPRRPQSHPIDDQHWDLIQHCWSPIQERPSAEHLVSNVRGFLQPYPHPQSFCGLLGSQEKCDLRSTSGVPQSPSNIERFSSNPRRPSEDLHLVTPGQQQYSSQTTRGFSTPRGAQISPHLIPASIWPTPPLTPLTYSGSAGDRADGTSSQPICFRSTPGNDNQNTSAVGPDASITDSAFPRPPPLAHSKSGVASPPFLDLPPMGLGQPRMYPYPCTPPHQYSVLRHSPQGTTDPGRGDIGVTSGSHDEKSGIWSFFSRFSPSPRRSQSPLPQLMPQQPPPPCTPQSQIRSEPPTIKKSACRSRGIRSLDPSCLPRSPPPYPSPSMGISETSLYYRFAQAPTEPLCSGFMPEGSISSSACSDFISPLLLVEPGVIPDNSPAMAPPRPQLDTAASKLIVANELSPRGSGSRRRKQSTNFLCPVPGCGNTFTRSFNLKAHLRTHKKESSFHCDWPGCGTTNLLQQDLRRHQEIHAKGLPFTCERCNKSFVRIGALSRHRVFCLNRLDPVRSETGAECRHTSDIPRNSEEPLIPKTEEKGRPAVSILI